jgi:protein SCO1
MKHFAGSFIMMCILAAGLSSPANAYEAPSQNPAKLAHQTPTEIQGVGVDEKLSQRITRTLPFTDHTGKAVTLGDYFQGKKPVLMSMVYYNCPSLCNFHLNGLLEVFKKLDMQAGRDFEFVAISMDHTETAGLADGKRSTYLKELKQTGADAGWHFLVGNEQSVKQIASELGFKFKWIEETEQFAHAAVAYVLTPDAVISRYLYGIDFPPKTLRLSFVEASDGKVGNIIDQIILFCFQFDPSKNKYSLYAFNLMQMGALLTVLLIGIFLVPTWLKERRHKEIG